MYRIIINVMNNINEKDILSYDLRMKMNKSNRALEFIESYKYEVLFLIFVFIRLLFIYTFDGLHHGDAISRTAGAHHMVYDFRLWPTEIWLPFPFWINYIFSAMFYDWIYTPRILPVIFVGAGLYFLARAIKNIISDHVALAFFLLSTFSTPHIFIEAANLSEPYYVALLGLFIWLMTIVDSKQTLKAYLAAAICLAFLCLTRYEAYLFLPFVTAMIMIRNKKEIFTGKMILAFIIISTAVIYMFYMNYLFGGSILWGIEGEHVIEVANFYKMFSFNDSINWYGGFLLMMPLSWLSLIFGTLGGGYAVIVSESYWQKAIYLFLIAYVMFIIKQFATGYIMPDYRYHYLSSIILLYFSAYMLGNLKIKSALFIFIGCFILMQPFSYHRILEAHHYTINMDKGLSELIKFTKTKKEIRYKRHLIDRRIIYDNISWHADIWSYYIDSHLYQKVFCLTENYPLIPERTYSTESTLRCIKKGNVDFLILFNDGLVKRDFYSKKNPFVREQWNIIYSNLGYEIYERIRSN